MRAVFQELYGHYFGHNNLYLGCGMDHTASDDRHKWINLDYNSEVKPDVVFNLNESPLPFESESFNCIFSCHCLEHVKSDRFIYLIAELHRILAPGGWFVSIVPYGSSDAAWGMPQHNILFNELTWGSLDSRTYETPGNYGYMDTEGLPFKKWDMVRISLVPWPEFADDPQLEWKVKHYRNVINEMHVIMKRVE